MGVCVFIFSIEIKREFQNAILKLKLHMHSTQFRSGLSGISLGLIGEIKVSEIRGRGLCIYIVLIVNVRMDKWTNLFQPIFVYILIDLYGAPFNLDPF